MGAYTAFEVTPCGLASHKGWSYFCDKMPDGRDHTRSPGYLTVWIYPFYLETGIRIEQAKGVSFFGSCGLIRAAGADRPCAASRT